MGFLKWISKRAGVGRNPTHTVPLPSLMKIQNIFIMLFFKFKRYSAISYQTFLML
jgi:hypothetical protein